MEAEILPAAPLDPVQLMLSASPLVKLVLLSLVAMSVICWYVVGAKLVQLARAQSDSGRFLTRYRDAERAGARSGEAIGRLFTALRDYPRAPFAVVFGAGYHELEQLKKSELRGSEGLDNLERALSRAQGTELARLDRSLSLLATSGSVAPFVGLFGTVWGIMSSFLAIHGARGASLAVVAPGIAEALIATAIGLAVAIPAVMAYNYFVSRLRRVEGELEAFSKDYLNLLRRHLMAS